MRKNYPAKEIRIEFNKCKHITNIYSTQVAQNCYAQVYLGPQKVSVSGYLTDLNFSRRLRSNHEVFLSIVPQVLIIKKGIVTSFKQNFQNLKKCLPKF